MMGIWVAVLPYLGFPYSWKGVLTTITGVGLIYFSYILYQEAKMKGNKKEETFDNFSENKFVNESTLENEISTEETAEPNREI